MWVLEIAVNGVANSPAPISKHIFKDLLCHSACTQSHPRGGQGREHTFLPFLLPTAGGCDPDLASPAGVGTLDPPPPFQFYRGRKVRVRLIARPHVVF